MYGPERRWYASRLNDPTRSKDSLIAPPPGGQSWGTEPAQDLTSLPVSYDMPRSVYERLPSHMVWLGEQLALKSKTAQSIDQDFKAFRQGVTPSELDQREQQALALQGAASLAQQTAELDDEQFRSLLEQLQAAAADQVRGPERPELRRPNDLQLGVAGLAALLSPEHAFDSLSVPLAHGLRQQEQGYQEDVQRFERESDARKERVGFLSQMLGIENQRSLARQDARERSIGRQFDLSTGELERLSRERIAKDNNEYRMALKEYDADVRGQRERENKAFDAYYRGKDIETRQRAWTELADYGYDLPEPTELTADEKLKGAQAGYYGARTKTIEETRSLVKDKLRSQIKLNERNAERLSKVVYWFDEEAQARIARTWKQLEDIDSRIAYRSGTLSVAEAKLVQDGMAKAQSSINATLSSLSTQANQLRQQISPLERELYGRDWDDTDPVQRARKNELVDAIKGYKASITLLQQAYAETKSEAASVRAKVEDAARRATGGSNTTGRARIESLRDTFSKTFPGGTTEQWAPQGGRNVQGTSTPSLHNDGLALDLRAKDLQAVADWAVKQPGIQTVIFNRRIWSPGKGWRPYDKDPHLDHVHVDYGRGAATNGGGKPSGKVKVPGVGEVTYSRG